MEFLFECLTRYLTSERSERVRCRVEEKRKEKEKQTSLMNENK